MRIALCISGQPRTWKPCYQNWFENFSGDHEIDVFFHFWSYNTHPTLLRSLPEREYFSGDIDITEEEKKEIIETLKPKKYIFDNRKLTIYDEQPYITKHVQTPLGWWCRSQFHSIKQATYLKRQYEVENKFEYDFVLRWRTDIWLLKPVKFPDIVEPNTMYTTHNGWVDNVECYQVGDMLFGGDSFSMDQVSNLVEGYNFIDTYHVVPRHIKCPPPEVGIYPFIKSLGIKNKSWTQYFKTYRPKEYIELKGYIDDFEITEHSSLP